MLQITAQTKIFVAIEPVDFRKQIDGLVGVCLNILKMDPLSGVLFVFTNRCRNAIKLLTYDGQGHWLSTKRLSKGKFQWWPKSTTLLAQELQTLLWNGHPRGANFAKAWREN